MSLSLQGRIDALVIGASAGGIEALGVLLPALPATLSVPMIAVQHLPRDHASLLADIFQPKCARPIREAQDKEALAPGTVYFAPPDYHVLIDDGPQLALSSDELVNYSRPSIDVLFESAVDVYGPRLAAILLTGASHDGAAGVAAIERAGGIVIVQDPKEAQVSVMVQSALARAKAPVVLRLAEIAGAMRTLATREGA